jgi:hypothetical protein
VTKLKTMQDQVFYELIAPLTNYIKQSGSKIDKKSGSKVLFFEDFLRVTIYGLSIGVSSMRKLIKELSSNPSADLLHLPQVAYSTFRDGFTRFNILYFNELYKKILSEFDWSEVKELSNLGVLKAVDGSLFPTLRSMEWASYKRSFKALKLHLSFNLNTCCPNEFLISEGNKSERSFLIDILEQGVTYICDRGYFSFEVLDAMNKIGAMFVLRLKDVNKFDVGKILNITGHIPQCFRDVKDELIRFCNQKEQKVYRIVRFKVMDSHFILCTNRLDLTTIQVIMLYAYRWQIELIFKFLKRTLNGLHLFAQTENAAPIHFYMLLITALLQLRLKQCFLRHEEKNIVKNEKKHITILTNTLDTDTYLGAAADKWMNSINNVFGNGFKISSDWLLYLRNLIAQNIDSQLIMKFNSV